jgi:gliding motility-associated-like protein
MITRLPKLILSLVLSLIFYTTGAQTLTPLWVNDVGGNGPCQTSGMGVDAQSNVYITGIFQSTVDFDPSPTTVFNLSASGGWDIFMAKYKADGTLIWAKSFAGDALDQANSLAVTADGVVTITGQFQSMSLDANPGTATYYLNNKGTEDSFAIRLDKDGNFLWAASVGGSSTDRGNDVANDKDGNVIVASQFQGSLTVGNATYNTSSTFNGLLVKYSAAGNVLWSINLGQSGDNEARGVTTDNDNNIYVSGAYSGVVNFNPNGTALNSPNNGGGTFLAKYSPAGQLIWVKQITGQLNNNLSNICVDTRGAVYISGNFSTSLVFDATRSLSPRGPQDIYVAKYTATGSLLWAKSAGNFNGSPYCYRITSDAANNVFFTGYYTGTVDFNPDPVLTNNLTYHGSRDLFICKYDTDGNYAWAYSYGNASCSSTFGVELAVDRQNNVLLGGAFCSTVNFDANQCSTYNLTAKNFTSDTYVAKYNQNGQVPGSPQITSFAIPQQISPAVIDQTNYIITANVPAGTSLTALAPVIATTPGSKITPLSATTRNFTSPVTYSVALNNGCGVVSYSVNVLVNTAVATCSGIVNLLTGKVLSSPPDAYLWEVLQGGTWVTAPGTSNQADYETSGFTNVTGSNVVYYLRRKVITSGIGVYDSFYDLTVYSTTGSNSISANKLIFCPGNTDPFIFTGNQPVGYNSTGTYRWEQSFDAVTWTIVPAATQQNLQYTQPVTQITYFRRVTILNTCIAYSNILKIDVAPPITTALAGSDQKSCLLTQATLSANSPAANEVGTWTVISPLTYSPFNSSNLHDPKATISAIPTDVDVVLQWTLSNASCAQQSTDQVTVFNTSIPLINAGINIEIDEGEHVELTSNVTNGGNYTVEWSPAETLDNPASTNPVAYPKGTTIYNLKVTTSTGCIAESSVKVTVSPFVFPNTFTPNGDGTNDTWQLKKLQKFTNNQVWIYNRWGQLMFYSKGYAAAWDGTFEGKKLPTGVYYYIIKIADLDTTRKGSVTIVN